MDVFSGSCTWAKVGTELAISPDCSAIEADRLVEAASTPVTAQVGTEDQATNLERGGQARKSRAGRAREIRRGPRKAVVGEAGEGRLHGVRRKTRRRQSSGGDRAGGSLNHFRQRRIRERRKALKAGTWSWRHWIKLLAGVTRKRQEGNGGRRARAASREGKPLESEPWTRQRGEIDPQGRKRSKPSRTCETSRAERSGLGTPA